MNPAIALDPAIDTAVEVTDTEVSDVPENEFEEIVLGLPWNITERRAVVPLKALSPMVVTDDGMVTDGREVQPEKAPPTMVVTEDGIVTDVREVQ